MDLREDCDSTEREQAENETQSADHSLSTKPSRSADGRLMYYERQLQRSENYSGFLDEWNIPIDELRALYAEITDYFGVCSYWDFPLPPAGLPGLLHEKYDRDEEAASLLLLGIQYVGAVIRNERKGMHNRWKDARQLVYKIEERASERVHTAIIERQVERAREYEAQTPPQTVYFIGAASGPIKIGIAVNALNRLKGLQTGHHEKLEILATCEGNTELERSYHKRFADRRLNGEWFERCSEIETEIARLNRSEP